MTAKSKLRAVAIAATLLIGTNCGAQTVQSEPKAEISYKSTELFLLGAYRFVAEQRFSKFPEDAEPLGLEETLVVFKDGLEVHRQKGWRWDVYPLKESTDSSAPKPGTDITGDGIPDVVLIDESGGSHDPGTYYIFELRDGLPVRKFASAISFAQRDHTPELEISRRDTTFEDWKAPSHYSAAPNVLLRYRNGAYEPAPDLMRTPPPSQAKFAELVRDASTGDGWEMETKPRNAEYAWDIGYQFLWTVIDLIYTGHADLVPRFVDAAWPSAKPGKQEFIEELMECRIRVSSYWPTIATLNGLPADPPIGKCLRGDNEG